MPYPSIDDLPESVRAHLPAAAQEIFRAAFNRAYERYGAADEARAFRMAWGAVKRTYVKADGEWRRRAS